VNGEMLPFLRTAGPSISPFNAWVILKGLETLELRMRAQSAAALELAAWLQSHPKVTRVYYPGLPSHPQHELARRQQRAAGAVLSFEVKGGREAAWRVLDSTRLVSLTANLGDVKTTIVNGKILMRDRRVLTLNERQVLADARAQSEKVKAAVK